jgi:hypothetical protein
LDLQQKIPYLSLGYCKFKINKTFYPKVNQDLIQLSYLVRTKNFQETQLKNQIKLLLNNYSKSESFLKLKEKYQRFL